MAKEIIVTIVTTRRKSQRFTFTINDGSGPDMAVKEFYTRAYTAKRGAIRQLQAKPHPRDFCMVTFDGRRVYFKTKKN